MATEYSVWVFGADPLMNSFDSPTFKSQAEHIRNKLNDLGRDGWRVVGTVNALRGRKRLWYRSGGETRNPNNISHCIHLGQGHMRRFTRDRI
jgi:hypothetical protein